MISPRSDDGTLRSWPLYVLAAPATVAVWSGWVGLGEMTGFGKVHPLPGIADHFSINTAITLPIGVEAYAAYALGAWLSRKTLSDGTRKFARTSAIGALALGALGQIAYHLLEVGHRTHAPTWITTLVACFPVLVLGMGATLAHLIHRDARSETSGPNEIPVPEVGPAAEPWTMPQTWSVERSETTPGDQSETPVPDQPAEQVPGPVETNSADQVPDQPSDQSRTTEAPKAQTGPKKRSRTRKPKTKADPLDRLAEAMAVDKQHVADHGRHISAENLAKVLRIGKPAALELVKQVRGAHMDIAK